MLAWQLHSPDIINKNYFDDKHLSPKLEMHAKAHAIVNEIRAKYLLNTVIS